MKCNPSFIIKKSSKHRFNVYSFKHINNSWYDIYTLLHAPSKLSSVQLMADVAFVAAVSALLISIVICVRSWMNTWIYKTKCRSLLKVYNTPYNQPPQDLWWGVYHSVLPILILFHTISHYYNRNRTFRFSFCTPVWETRRAFLENVQAEKLFIVHKVH